MQIVNKLIESIMWVSKKINTLSWEFPKYQNITEFLNISGINAKFPKTTIKLQTQKNPNVVL